MAKVYFCRFTDKKTQKVFYKFGHTSKSDVLERFDPKYDTRYSEFAIEPICSIRGELVWCQQIEEIFKSLYPKNIWLEEYFGDDRTWDNFSGITEVVFLDTDEYHRVRTAFYKVKQLQDGLRNGE
jgi:hypothetical protein